MPTNLVQNGNRVTQTVAAAVVSGRLYALAGGGESAANGLPAIAAVDGAIGAAVDFIVEGVWNLPKANEAGSALNIGDIVYWKDVGGINTVTGLATGATGVAGTAWSVAGDSATSVLVKLLEQGGKAATP